MTIDAIVQKLKGRKPLPSLVPRKRWDAEISKAVSSLGADGRAPLPTQPLKAALYLWNDELERAHEIAQEIDTPTGSLIHGVMHRRQPDYANSKYWFRRVGEHALFALIRKEFPDWDPFRFIDQCEEAAKGKGSAVRAQLERVQARELDLLVARCRAER